MIALSSRFCIPVSADPKPVRVSSNTRADAVVRALTCQRSDGAVQERQNRRFDAGPALHSLPVLRARVAHLAQECRKRVVAEVERVAVWVGAHTLHGVVPAYVDWLDVVRVGFVVLADGVLSVPARPAR